MGGDVALSSVAIETQVIGSLIKLHCGQKQATAEYARVSAV
jgi:hypothetical protein